MPGVAKALAQLVSSLGGHAAAQAEAAPAAEPHIPALKPSALGAEYMAASASQAVEAPPPVKPKKPRKRPEPKPDPVEAEVEGLSEDERYEKWFQQLPENSQRFLGTCAAPLLRLCQNHGCRDARKKQTTHIFVAIRAQAFRPWYM